jgi:predicted glycosyltransferase
VSDTGRNDVQTTRRGIRVAMYSHDTMGLGHVRRNLLIAQTLRRGMDATVLMICGAWEAGLFELPDGVDCLTLPSLRKSEDGRYEPRRLEVPVDRLTDLRSRTIASAVESFAPDVLVVDKVPRGAGGELDRTLEVVSRQGARCVLGLRDVLDDPETVRREWRAQASEEAIARFYDAVWVYGDPAVYDPVREYGLRLETAAKLTYTGYLDRRSAAGANRTSAADVIESLELPPGRLAVCSVGGGQDGGAVATAFAQAFSEGHVTDGMNGLVLTGPFMAAALRQKLRRLCGHGGRLKMLEFVADAGPLIGAADAVVTMGGYNTVCEAMSHGTRALVVPRVTPRAEQLIRARRLEELGMLDVLHPSELSPQRVAGWLAAGDARPPTARASIDFSGLDRLCGLMDSLLNERGTSVPSRTAVRLEALRPPPEVPEQTKVTHATR